MDVKLEFTTDAQSTTYATDGLPSMALDSGSPPAIHDRGRLCRNDGGLVIMILLHFTFQTGFADQDSIKSQA